MSTSGSHLVRVLGRVTALAGALLSACACASWRPALDPAAAREPAFLASCDPAVTPTPLVLGADSTERSKLAFDRYRPAVVVQYACDTDEQGGPRARLRVLENCRVYDPRARYAYVDYPAFRVTPYAWTSDLLRANLPLGGGATIAAQLGARDFVQATYTDVGKFTAPLGRVGSGSLGGPGDACLGATHVVRAAHVGAFALSTAVEGEGGASVAAMGVGLSGGVASASGTALASGDPQGCLSSSPGRQAPPPECSAPVQLELLAIAGPPVPREVDLPSCLPPLVMSRGSCVAVRPGIAYACRWTNPFECAAQCDAQDAASCNSLGWWLERNGLAREAAHLYQRACSAGHWKGCANLGLLLRRFGVWLPQADAALAAACDGAAIDYACAALLDPAPAGVAVADPTVGRLPRVFIPSSGGVPQPQPGATATLQSAIPRIERACRAGDVASCERLTRLGRAP